MLKSCSKIFVTRFRNEMISDSYIFKYTTTSNYAIIKFVFNTRQKVIINNKTYEFIEKF